MRDAQRTKVVNAGFGDVPINWYNNVDEIPKSELQTGVVKQPTAN